MLRPARPSSVREEIYSSGFRPEDLELNSDPGSGAVRIEATVDVIEYLGHEELLHAQTDGSELVALVPSQKVRPGDNVQFALRSDKLHLFDPEREQRLDVVP